MFFKQAQQGRNDVMYYLIGVILIGLAYVLGQFPLVLYAAVKAASLPNGAQELSAFTEDLDFSRIGINANVGLFLILLTFVSAFGMLYVVVTKIHQRSFRSLITTYGQLNWSKIAFAFALWMLFSILLEGVSFVLAPENYVWQFNGADFWPLLLIAIFILPIQTSFEELFFRGYLMQGLGNGFGNRWMPLLITSALFGAMHLLNPEIKAFGLGLMMTYYITFGLFLGIISLMDNSLELALGIHAATNIFGAAIVTFDGSALQTPALFKALEVSVELILPVFFVLAALFIFICSRYYHWQDWTLLYRTTATSDFTPPAAEIEIEHTES